MIDKMKLLLSLMLFFSISLYSLQVADSCSLVGQIDNIACFAIFVKDNFAYVGDGGYFRIYNVQYPSNPVFRGQVTEPSDVNGIFVVGNYAYVADGAGGLRIINVANPSSPSHVRRHDTDAALDVFVVDNLAYIADGTSGLRIINVSNPNSPSQVGYYNTPGSAFGVYVINDTVYVADHTAGLRILDATNLSSITEIGHYSLGVGTYADGIHVIDSIAYVAYRNLGLRIIDVADPGNPEEIGDVATADWAEDVFVKGNLAYVADRYGGLRVVLVSDHANPVEVGYYNTTSDYDVDVYVKDSLAYVAAGATDGFYIVKYIGHAGVEEEKEKLINIENNLTSIKINYFLRNSTRVNINIYNILGQKVTTLVNSIQNTGNYSTKWSGSSGIYFIKAEIGNKTYSEKAIILQ
ncbi:T9SS type A sorting domain-containing protein [candidate division WOR-3 bacterium]|nr:T9SS type A sorting domain-containing protein [candidate division WOR-3 bacterium]